MMIPRGMGTLREIPEWCNLPGVDVMFSLLGTKKCMPYTYEELRKAQELDLIGVCKHDTTGSCLTRAYSMLEKSDSEVQAAATEEPPPEVCKTSVTSTNPVLASVLGVDAACWVISGEFKVWLIAGAALLLLNMTTPRRPLY